MKTKRPNGMGLPYLVRNRELLSRITRDDVSAEDEIRDCRETFVGSVPHVVLNRIQFLG